MADSICVSKCTEATAPSFLTQQREPDFKCSVAPEERVGEIVEKAETKKGWMFPTWNEVEAYGFPNELRHFVSCVVEGKQPCESYEDGLLVNKVVDAAYRSAKSKRWESI